MFKYDQSFLVLDHSFDMQHCQEWQKSLTVQVQRFEFD